MKKYVPLFLGIFGIIAFVFTSCKPEPYCIDCQAEGIAMVPYPIGDSATITIYPIMTPNNYDFCDSMVYSPSQNGYVEPYLVYPFQKKCTEEEARDSLQAGNDTACPCRINKDTVYNDTINTFLYIKGLAIEKGKDRGKIIFPNRLNIKVLGDTSKIRSYTDYNNTSNIFNAWITFDPTLGYYEYINSRTLAPGIYEYELILYKDKTHQVPFDTLKGPFAIIRSPKDINKNCAIHARYPNDPLLKK